MRELNKWLAARSLLCFLKFGMVFPLMQIQTVVENERKMTHICVT